MINTILFDVDGVLLDSLPAHLKICKDLATRYNQGFLIPPQEQIKLWASNGATLSPMEHFFEVVGFPSNLIDNCMAFYEDNFAANYPVKPFDGIGEMIQKLRKENYLLGIVTSNIFGNICNPLREYLPEFTTIIDKNDCETKAHGIIRAMSDIEVLPRQTIYIGDTGWDEVVADAAGVEFAGVSYSWGLTEGIGSIGEIPAYINSLNGKDHV